MHSQTITEIAQNNKIIQLKITPSTPTRVASNPMAVISSTSGGGTFSDDDFYFSSKPRLQSVIDRNAYYIPDIMQIKMTAMQTTHRILAEAVRICMVFYGMAAPQATRLHLFDPRDIADRRSYATRGFVHSVRLRAQPQLERFIRNWIQRRRRLKFWLQLYRHWSTVATPPTSLLKSSDDVPKTQLPVRTIKYDLAPEEEDDVSVSVGAVEAAARAPCNRHSFVFEAKFSAPRRQRPTPQCTASVYFWFDLDEFDWTASLQSFERQTSISVPFRYQFEGMVYQYSASVHGHPFDFQEDILLGILDDKSKLYASLEF